MTKVKPQRLNITWTPTAGKVPKFVDNDTFERWEGGGWSAWPLDILVTELVLWGWLLQTTWSIIRSAPYIEITLLSP